ncbi:hypothetical protein [Aminobacter ciceronei]|uniref:Uncharacterized protein n=1 Tax=Aminobacter ciceronei TaxID=150723 RepID=A0ABR6CAP7_9HYPH|nr:hypothetical protein [Aminobacter ciceronei]MBA8907948.1 hypothetical protein [Aminobacter ciceronei]MBA9021703.1 hypothetical protein [Aminobacter ciceronei]
MNTFNAIDLIPAIAAIRDDVLVSRVWVECGPISLLDRIFEDVVFEGETCRVGLEYAIVPAAELEGLADILDTIRRQMGIAFIAARV